MPNGPSDQARLQIEVLLSEYQALYRLAEFRLGALDRRIPLIGGVLTAFLGTLPLLPGPSQVLGLVAVPISLTWLVRTTINHARSFEDALRGVEGAEKRINDLLGEEIVSFQSTHPSRGESVGGRTGAETVNSVILGSCLLLSICLWMSLEASYISGTGRLIYALGLATVSGTLMTSVWRWSNYRYPQRNQL